MTVPSITTNALGYGAFLGLYANLRYQLLCGFERAMSNHFDVIGVALFFGTAVRYILLFHPLGNLFSNGLEGFV